MKRATEKINQVTWWRRIKIVAREGLAKKMMSEMKPTEKSEV